MGLFKKKQNEEQKKVSESTSSNVSSKRIHVSGYVFQDMEELISENRVLSPKGDGWLLITSSGMFLILDSEGIHMNLKHEMIESFVVENNKVSVSWNEESKRFDYQFRIKDGELDAKRLVNLANETFHYRQSSVQQMELSESDIVQTRTDYVDRVQKIIEFNQKKEKELEQQLDEIENTFSEKQKKRKE